MKAYATVTEAIAGLRARGYTRDFNLKQTFIECSSSGEKFAPNEFEITEVYRFEGETNPSDEAVVYAVQSKDEKMKGTLVNAYGTYADSMSNEMIKKLSMNRN